MLTFGRHGAVPDLSFQKSQNEAGDSFKAGKINVDEERELASAFQVMSIPTLMVYDGKPVKTVVGFRTKEELLAMLK